MTFLGIAAENKNCRVRGGYSRALPNDVRGPPLPIGENFYGRGNNTSGCA